MKNATTQKLPLPLAQRLPALLLIAGIFYNTIAALINAHVTAITPLEVTAAEGIIILLTALFVGCNLQCLKSVSPHIAFIFAALLLFCWISLFNDSLYVKSLGDMILIPLFIMVGQCFSEGALIKTFRFITLVVVFFMVQECWFTESYVRLFEPASYFANTRGIEELSVDTSGLFRNSLGFEGRFSFGILNTHRLSSIFLEQVSLANFSMVLGLFASAFWQCLKRFDRVLSVLSIAFILVGNNSRTASIVCLLLFIGYFVFPRLPKFSNSLYMPLVLLVCFVFYFNPTLDSSHLGDDLQGRIEKTLLSLDTLDLRILFTGNIVSVSDTADSGYVYLIYSQTIIGLILFWLYTSFITPAESDAARRFSHGMCIYIALNLMIGTAIFTIKVSAPLWVIAGYLYQRNPASSLSGSSHASAQTCPELA